MTAPPTSALDDPTLRPGRGDLLLLAGAVALALGLRLALLEHRSFWWDELFARYWMELPVATLLGPASRVETNPPLYFLALKAWAGLVGTRDGALRLPSALASGAAAAIAGRLGLLAGGARVGVLAAFLCALAPLGLFTGLNARPLAFFPLLQGLCLLAAAEYLRGAGRAGAAALPLRSRLLWVGLYGLAALLQVHLHATGVVFVAATGTAMAVACLADRRLGVVAFRDWAAVGLLIGLLSAPQLLTYLDLRDAAPIAWARPPSPFTLAQILGRALFAGEGQIETPLWRALFLLALPVAFGLIALGAWALRGTLQVWPAVILPAAFLVALIGVSFLRPMWATRFLVGTIVPASVLFAAALARLWPQPAGKGIGGLFLALLAAFGLNQTFGRTEHREWFIATRALAARLEAEPACRGPVAVNRTYLTLPFWRHYGSRLAAAEGVLLVEDELAARGPVWHAETLAFLHAAGLPVAPSRGISAFAAEAASVPHVSLVLRDDATLPLGPALGGLIATLEQRFARRRETSYGTPDPPDMRFRVICFADPADRG